MRCQAFSNLSNSMRQFVARVTHATFFSERTPSSEKTAELNEQPNIYPQITKPEKTDFEQNLL